MTTRRLYYENAFLTTFEAQIVETGVLDHRPYVVTDQSAFYPTGGGQPADTGVLSGRRVLDVISRSSDGAVLHILDALPDASAITGEIDWNRRFDHMQHHSGQHILSQAFIRVTNAATVGFHMSDNAVTIDLDQLAVSSEHIQAAESLANEIIWENRPVTARLVGLDELEGVRIRKLPEAVHTDGIRVVTIADFDQTACGGTHVLQTGQVGSLGILRAEKRGEKTRIEFVCGARAVSRARQHTQIVNELTARLTVAASELPLAVERSRARISELERQAAELNDLRASLEADALRAVARQRDSVTIVTQVFQDLPVEQARRIAQALVRPPGTLALLAVMLPDRAQLLFARSEDVGIDVSSLLRDAISQSNGKGGGQPASAQGTVPLSDSSAIESLLRSLIP